MAMHLGDGESSRQVATTDNHGGSVDANCSRVEIFLQAIGLVDYVGMFRHEGYDDLDALRSMDHEEFQECVNATNMKAGHAATLRLALALKEEYTSLAASTNSSEVHSFLESCKLGEYCELFIRQGYNNMMVLRNLDDREFAQCAEATGMKRGHKLKLRQGLGRPAAAPRPPPPPSPPIPLCDDLSAGSSTEDHHLASLPQAPTTAEIATEGYTVSLGVSADATMNGENSNDGLSILSAETFAEMATEGCELSLGVSADATMNGENSNFDGLSILSAASIQPVEEDTTMLGVDTISPFADLSVGDSHSLDVRAMDGDSIASRGAPPSGPAPAPTPVPAATTTGWAAIASSGNAEGGFKPLQKPAPPPAKGKGNNNEGGKNNNKKHSSHDSPPNLEILVAGDEDGEETEISKGMPSTTSVSTTAKSNLAIYPQLPESVLPVPDVCATDGVAAGSNVPSESFSSDMMSPMQERRDSSANLETSISTLQEVVDNLALLAYNNSDVGRRVRMQWARGNQYNGTIIKVVNKLDGETAFTVKYDDGDCRAYYFDGNGRYTAAWKGGGNIGSTYSILKTVRESTDGTQLPLESSATFSQTAVPSTQQTIRVKMFACVRFASAEKQLLLRIFGPASFRAPVNLLAPMQIVMKPRNKGSENLALFATEFDIPKKWRIKGRISYIRYSYEFGETQEVFTKGATRCFRLVESEQESDKELTVCDDEILDPDMYTGISGMAKSKQPRRYRSMKALLSYFLEDLQQTGVDGVHRAVARITSLGAMGRMYGEYGSVQLRSGATSFLTTQHDPTLSSERECVAHRNKELKEHLEDTSSLPVLAAITRCLFGPEKAVGDPPLELSKFFRCCSVQFSRVRGFSTTDIEKLGGMDRFGRAVLEMIKVPIRAKEASYEWLLAIPMLHLLQGENMKITAPRKNLSTRVREFMSTDRICQKFGASAIFEMESCKNWQDDISGILRAMCEVDTQLASLVLGRLFCYGREIMSHCSKLPFLISPEFELNSTGGFVSYVPFSIAISALQLQLDRALFVAKEEYRSLALKQGGAVNLGQALELLSTLAKSADTSDLDNNGCQRLCFTALKCRTPRYTRYENDEMSVDAQLLTRCVQLLTFIGASDETLAECEDFLQNSISCGVVPKTGVAFRNEVLDEWSAMLQHIPVEDGSASSGGSDSGGGSASLFVSTPSAASSRQSSSDDVAFQKDFNKMLVRALTDRLNKIDHTTYLDIYAEANLSIEGLIGDVIFERADNALQVLLGNSQAYNQMGRTVDRLRNNSRMLAVIMIKSWPGIRGLGRMKLSDGVDIINQSTDLETLRHALTWRLWPRFFGMQFQGGTSDYATRYIQEVMEKVKRNFTEYFDRLKAGAITCIELKLLVEFSQGAEELTGAMKLSTETLFKMLDYWSGILANFESKKRKIRDLITFFEDHPSHIDCQEMRRKFIGQSHDDLLAKDMKFSDEIGALEASFLDPVSVAATSTLFRAVWQQQPISQNAALMDPAMLLAFEGTCKKVNELAKSIIDGTISVKAAERALERVENDDVAKELYLISSFDHRPNERYQHLLSRQPGDYSVGKGELATFVENQSMANRIDAIMSIRVVQESREKADILLQAARVLNLTLSGAEYESFQTLVQADFETVALCSLNPTVIIIAKRLQERITRDQAGCLALLSKAPKLIEFLKRFVDSRDFQNFVTFCQDSVEEPVDVELVADFHTARNSLVELLFRVDEGASFQEYVEKCSQLRTHGGSLTAKARNCADRLDFLIDLVDRAEGDVEKSSFVKVKAIRATGVLTIEPTWIESDQQRSHVIRMNFTLQSTDGSRFNDISYDENQMSDLRSKLMLVSGDNTSATDASPLEISDEQIYDTKEAVAIFVEIFEEAERLKEELRNLLKLGSKEFEREEFMVRFDADAIETLRVRRGEVQTAKNHWEREIIAIREQHYYSCFYRVSQLVWMCELCERNLTADDQVKLTDWLRCVHKDYSHDQSREFIARYRMAARTRSIEKLKKISELLEEVGRSCMSIYTLDRKTETLNALLKDNVANCLSTDNEEETCNTILSLYCNDRSMALPHDEEVFLCSKDSTAEDLRLFFRRCFGANQAGRGQLMFCLGHLERCNYEVQVEAAFEFERLRRLHQEVNIFRLVVVSSEPESHLFSSLRANGHVVQNFGVACRMEIEDIQDFMHINSGEVVVVKSMPGQGKSHYIHEYARRMPPYDATFENGRLHAVNLTEEVSRSDIVDAFTPHETLPLHTVDGGGFNGGGDSINMVAHHGQALQDEMELALSYSRTEVDREEADLVAAMALSTAQPIRPEEDMLAEALSLSVRSEQDDEMAAAMALSMETRIWICPVCTLENNYVNKNCIACGSKQPSEETALPLSAGASAAVAAELMSSSQIEAVKVCDPPPSIYIIEVALTAHGELSQMLTELLVLKVIRGGTPGSIFRLRPQDKVFVECLESNETGFCRPSAPILDRLPEKRPFTPAETVEEGAAPLGGLHRTVSGSMGEMELPIAYKRVAFYLRDDRNHAIFRHERNAKSWCSDKDALTRILTICREALDGEDPSWRQLDTFVRYMDQLLEDFELSPFCGNALEDDVPGFSEFVLDFLLRGAKDFTTPTMTNTLVPTILTRRRWEDQDHAYLRFGVGFGSIDFFGFHVNKEGDQTNPETNEIVTENFLLPKRPKAASKELSQRLHQYGQNLQVARPFLQADYRNWDRQELLDKLYGFMDLPGEVMGHDVDKKYVLTSDNMKKMLAIFQRFTVGIPVIVMGATGCGKTALVKFMCTAMHYSIRGLGYKSYCELRIHGGTTRANIRAAVEEVIKIAASKNSVLGANSKAYTVLFLDECNTCSEMGYISKLICDNMFDDEYGRIRRIDPKLRVRFVAALNPYIRHTEQTIAKLEHAGLGFSRRARETLGEIPLRHLVYRVQPLPNQMRQHVWDFGRLTKDTEDDYVSAIVRNELAAGQLQSTVFANGNPTATNAAAAAAPTAADGGSSSTSSSTGSGGTGWTKGADGNWFMMEAAATDDHIGSLSQLTLQTSSGQDFESARLQFIPQAADLLSSCCKQAQKYMRDQKNEHSFVSMRDVERASKVFKWFHSNAGLLFPPGESPEVLTKRCIILTLVICYHSRLDEQRADFRHVMATRMLGDSCQIEGCRVKDAAEIEATIEDLENVFRRAVSYTAPRQTALNAALVENIYLMVVAIECKIPLFLVGKPGTSKSLAKSMVQDAMTGNESTDKEIFAHLTAVKMFSFQCSPLSKSEDIVKLFERARSFQAQKKDEHFTSVVVLDEIGLAEDSEYMPLKVLHSLLDPDKDKIEDHIAFLGISNWALDPAKMNRGIFVNRTTPTTIDLVSTAEAILGNSVQLQAILRPIAEAYDKVYKKQFEDDSWLCRDFYGLRDFYYMLKYIHHMHDRMGDRIDTNLLCRAVRRNFDGVPSHQLEAVVQMFLDQAQLGSESHALTPLELLADSLREHNSNSRYLLVITEGSISVGLNLLFNQELLPQDSCEVIFGSSFPADLEYQHLCRNINKIKICMETGRTCVLLNLRDLYESLYELLNQYYLSVGGKRYVEIGLGVHRVKCRVHDDFRLIVVADMEEVLSTFPIPLLNRLEKHTLSTSSILTEEQSALKNELEIWAENFHKRRLLLRRQLREPGRSIALRTTFIGYNLDLVSSLLRKASAASLHSADVLRNAKGSLLQLAAPDAVLRSNNSVLGGIEGEELRRRYFEDQHHHSLRDFLRGRAQRGAVCAVVTTHDTMKDSASGSSLEEEVAWEGHFFYPEGEKGHLVRLGHFDSETQFAQVVSRFIESAERRREDKNTDIDNRSGVKQLLMLVQCAEIDVELLTSAKHIVQSQINGNHALSVVFLVHLSRTRRHPYNAIPDLLWECAHVDSIFTPSKDEPDDKYLAQTLMVDGRRGIRRSEILQQGGDERWLVELSCEAMIEAGIQGALSRIVRLNDRGWQHIIQAIIESMNNVDSGEKEFLCSAVLSILRHQEESLTNNGRSWAETVANNVQSSTLRRALYRNLVDAVTDALACVFFHLDVNSGMELLFDKRDVKAQRFALSVAKHMFSSTDHKGVQEIDLKYIKPDATDINDRYTVHSTGFCGQAFPASFPQSHLIFDRLESLKPEILHDLSESQIRSGRNACGILKRLRTAIKSDESLKGFCTVVMGQESADYFPEYVTDLVAQRFVPTVKDQSVIKKGQLIKLILLLAAQLDEFKDDGTDSGGAGGDEIRALSGSASNVESEEKTEVEDQEAAFASKGGKDGIHLPSREPFTSNLDLASYQVASWVLGSRIQVICQLVDATANRVDTARDAARYDSSDFLEVLKRKVTSLLAPCSMEDLDKVLAEAVHGYISLNTNSPLQDWAQRVDSFKLAGEFMQGRPHDSDWNMNSIDTQFWLQMGKDWKRLSAVHLCYVTLMHEDDATDQMLRQLDFPQQLWSAETLEHLIRRLSERMNLEAQECGICGEFPRDAENYLVQLPCGHVFCSNCDDGSGGITGWIRQGYGHCPMDMGTCARLPAIDNLIRSPAVDETSRNEALVVKRRSIHLVLAWVRTYTLSASSPIYSSDREARKVIKLLASIISANHGHFSADARDEMLDATPAKRGALVRMLLLVDIRLQPVVAEYLDQALTKLQQPGMRDYALPQLLVYALEDAASTRWAATADAIQAATEELPECQGYFSAFAGALRQGPQEEDSVTMHSLQAVARMRAAATLLCDDAMRLAGPQPLSPSSDVLLRRFAALGPRAVFYLLKCVAQRNGRDAVLELVSSQAVQDVFGDTVQGVVEFLTGASAADATAANPDQPNREDPFLIYGQHYVDLRDAADIPARLRKWFETPSVASLGMMCLALSRTCAERRLIGRECDSNTLKAIDNISSIDVRNKQLLLKGVLEPTVEELCPSPEQSAQNWRLSQLATHALAAVSAHTTGPVSLIRLLCHHPEQLEDCILPAMASDPRLAVANARFDFTTWYQCRNGHPYAVGDCGLNVESRRCPVPGCGGMIGAPEGRHHETVADNRTGLMSGENGQYRGYTLKVNGTVSGERNLTASAIAALRIVLHATMLGAIASDVELVPPMRRLLKLGGDNSEVQHHLLQMLRLELEALRQYLDRNIDDVTTLLHAILKRVMEQSGGQNGAAVANSAALTEATRQSWEDKFNSDFIMPVFTNIQEVLAEASALMEQFAAKSGALRRVFRLLNDEEQTSWDARGMYQFRGPITVAKYRQNLATAPQTVLDECRVSFRVLELVKTLEAMKYVPSILRLQSALSGRLRHSLDRAVAEAMTIGEVLERPDFAAERSDLRECVDSFAIAWELAGPFVDEYAPGAKALEFLQDLGSDYARRSSFLGLEAPLALFMNGTVPYALVFYLLSKHNELMGSDLLSGGSSSTRTVIPLACLSTEHLVCLSSDRDVEPIFVANLTRIEGREEFDHRAINAELLSLVRGKPHRIDFGVNNLISNMAVAYRSDVGDMFIQLAQNISQEELSLEHQDRILQELNEMDRHQQDSGVTVMFDKVTQAIGFLHSTKTFNQPRMALSLYMTQVLSMPAGGELLGGVELRHIRSLWSLLDGTIAEAQARRGDDCFSELSRDYKQPLGERLQADLRARLVAVPGRQRILCGALRRLALSFERQNLYDPRTTPPEVYRLRDFWDQFIDLTTQEPFPDEVLDMVDGVPMSGMAEAWRTFALLEVSSATDRGGGTGSRRSDIGSIRSRHEESRAIPAQQRAGEGGGEKKPASDELLYEMD